jgi:hypothetical protein
MNGFSASAVISIRVLCLCGDWAGLVRRHMSHLSLSGLICQVAQCGVDVVEKFVRLRPWGKLLASTGEINCSPYVDPLGTMQRL